MENEHDDRMYQYVYGSDYGIAGLSKMLAKFNTSPTWLTEHVDGKGTCYFRFNDQRLAITQI